MRFSFRRSRPYGSLERANWYEAHRLRNVYKPTNKIGNAIKGALAPFDKLLLTATPLQNSLLELFGLVSIIDEHIFGDIKSFRSQFSRLDTDGDFQSLRERLKPICQRTLRRQVLEYIPFTNRIALVEEFIPSEPEQKLYNLVSDYLQRQNLYALPASQRQLMTLILRRLLASSNLVKRKPITARVVLFNQGGSRPLAEFPAGPQLQGGVPTTYNYTIS
jgi:SNF2 family DNA or RNA helicase